MNLLMAVLLPILFLLSFIIECDTKDYSIESRNEKAITIEVTGVFNNKSPPPAPIAYYWN